MCNKIRIAYMVKEKKKINNQIRAISVSIEDFRYRGFKDPKTNHSTTLGSSVVRIRELLSLSILEETRKRIFQHQN